MRRTHRTLSVMALTTAGLLAQNGATPPAFEVASIKQSSNAPRRTSVQNDRLDFSGISLKDLILHAYHLEAYQLQAPAWMSTQQYSIQAKLPAGAPKEQVPAMLQNLLAERLKLSVHHETKEQAVYALVVVNGGPKLKKSEPTTDPPDDSGRGMPPRPRPGSWTMRQTDSETIHVTGLRADMAALTRFLADKVHRPVLDNTGLTGEYDIEFDGKVALVETAPASSGSAPPPPPPPPTSMDVTKGLQQLGLRLDPQRAPVDYLIVDSALRVPAGN